MKTKIDFKELKHLHDLGFALHWIKPNSKAPVNSGWTTGPRLEWESFKKEYRNGYNVGTRLGRASTLENGLLTAIDIDVKDPAFKDEAHAALKKLFPNLDAPVVWSGRGNGSAHYYILSKEPIKGEARLTASDKQVKVKMPSVVPSKRDRSKLSEAELTEGFRMRAAWEISLLCEGRQIVLPGSVHPDSGRLYSWGQGTPPESWDLSVVAPPKAMSAASKPSSVSQKISTICGKFQEVDLSTLGLRPDQVNKIVDGDDVEDRSAEIFGLTMALLQRKVSEAEIISIFTDTRFFLGNTTYDHAKTKNRNVAANWFIKYTLAPAKTKVDASNFEFQKVEFDFEHNDNEWQKKLDVQPGPRGAPPTLRPTFNNVKLILENEISEQIIERNLFSHDDIWSMETPWGFKLGKKRSGNSDDALAVKSWLIDKFRLEVPIGVIDEVLSRLAVANGFHPVKDFLEGLEWDGEPRIETAFEVYLGAKMPRPYLNAVSKKFFLALIARIYSPGCKFDSLPVLEGKQGTGKSSFGRLLVGDEWFIDGLPDFADKDAAMYLQGIWLCELAELSTIYRSTKESAKAFISRTSDKIRPPYGHRRVDYPRSCVFLGSTNETDYLVDNTGNRRFWPVQIDVLDFEGLMRDRLQLLAEAKYLFDFEMEALYLQGKALRLAESVQEERRADDEADGMLSKFIKWQKENPDKLSFTMSDLFESQPFHLYASSRANYRNASMILRNQGFKKRHTMHGKRWVRSKRN